MPARAHDAPVLHLLVVDDDDPVREGCIQIAEKMGFAVRGASSVPEANAILKFEKMDVLLLDLRLPGGNALTLLAEQKELRPDIEVVVMTAYATVPSAVRAMQIGARHYITKPFALEELTTLLESAGERRQVDVDSRRLRERLRTEVTAGPLIGSSVEMEKLYRIISKVASAGHPVMIQGETGTGKETIARFIHFNGLTETGKFVPVDCGSSVASLVENELFGYAKGAFAGANRAREGLLSLSSGGTVFLDEVGDLSLHLQSRLLRALQDRQFTPVGAANPVPVTMRVLASTSRDMNALITQGRFRRDLYLRLNMVNLKIPALRERANDIPLLAMHFLNNFLTRLNEAPEKKATTKVIPESFADSTLRLLTLYQWPGNVKELEAAVEHACGWTSTPDMLPDALPTYLINFLSQLNAQQHSEVISNSLAVGSNSPGQTTLLVNRSHTEAEIISIAEMEKKMILSTINQLGGDKLKAAKLLGIGKTTLYRKLKEYGITDPM